MEKGKAIKQVTDFFLMTVGVGILTAGVYFFKIPNGFVTGGVSGVGTMLGSLFPVLSSATWIAVLNIFLLFVGFIVLGKETGVRTVYCSLLFSLFSVLLEWLFPMEKPLTGELFLELIYAIILTSIGSALLFHVGASSGGTDIIALILKKYTSLNTGKALLCTDFLIAASSFLTFGKTIGFYSVLGLLAKAFLVDSVIDHINSCKFFIVITDQPKEITQYMIEKLHRGVTTVDAVGEYTGTLKKMLHTVCHRSEAIQLRKRIRELDPHAFIIITTSSEILGKGFRQV